MSKRRFKSAQKSGGNRVAKSRQGKVSGQKPCSRNGKEKAKDKCPDCGGPATYRTFFHCHPDVGYFGPQIVEVPCRCAINKEGEKELRRQDRIRKKEEAERKRKNWKPRIVFL